MNVSAINYQTPFKILTFNLRRDGVFSRGARAWQSRHHLVSNLISSSGAAVVGVQEMLPHMKNDIGNTLANYSMYGHGRSDGGEHTDILVKNADADLLFHETFWLSKNPKKKSRAYYSFFPRICTVGEVEIKSSGRRVRVFNAHFDHICAPARVLGIYTILHRLHKLQQINPMPSIIMGDFNAGPNSHAIRILRENLHGYSDINLTDAYNAINHGVAPHNTYHGFGGKSGKMRLDYIFVTDGLEVENCEIDRYNNDGIYPSDHYPMLATLRFCDK